MRVVVVGLGKMGLPVAVRLAEGGAAVMGADVDHAVVEAVCEGRVPVSGPEAGLEERLASVHAAGRISATTDTAAAVGEADAVVILVRLVIDDCGIPDYAGLDAATAAVAAGLRRGAVVIYETTVPVGDTRHRFVPMLERGSGLTCGQDFHVCFSPERVQAGRVLANLDTYPKLIGGVTTECRDAGAAVYRQLLSAPVTTLSSLEAAEYTKIAENIYRDVNIALANELARYADQVEVDFREIVKAANSQPLSHIHQPGIGVGGHCIPVYPSFFIGRAKDSRLTALAREVNDGMPAYACDRLEELMGGLVGHRVLILGLAFRGGVREAAHSMAIPLAVELRRRGAEVRMHDPVFGPDGVIAHGFVWGEPEDGWADAAVLQADHTEYTALTPSSMAGVRAVVDGRGLLDWDVWRAGGVSMTGIGRSSS